MMIKNIIKVIALSGASGLVLASCASISESQCEAGNWADIGYRDGVGGKKRTRIADYVEKCGEYGQAVDRPVYLSNYETGLTHYCVYDKGFSLGENGSSYNSVCSGASAADFRIGYEDGHAQYELKQEYQRYESRIEESRDELADVRSRLNDSDLNSDEKKRLQKKARRLERRLDDLQWEFRDFRRKYNIDW